MHQWLHHSNLDTIGGVEHLLVDFLNSFKKGKHSLCITGKKPHSDFSKLLKDHFLCFTKYYMGLKIPSFLRPIHYQYVMKKLRPQGLVYWNQLPPLPPPPAAKLLFYDHGASWYFSEKELSHSLAPFHKLISCSYASKRMLELKGAKQSIHLIKNPLRSQLPPLSYGKTLNIKKTPLILGCSGRLIPLKGFITCLHLLFLLNKQGVDAELYIAGKGKDLTPLQEAAKHLSINKKIHFLGHVQNMASFFDRLDLFLCPSFREPFGLVALEAQARGLPVVANAIDGLVEVVDEGKSGFLMPPCIDPNELQLSCYKIHSLPPLVYHPSCDRLAPPLSPCPQAMAEKIIQLIDKPDFYQKYSQQALQRLENFKFQRLLKPMGKNFVKKLLLILLGLIPSLLFSGPCKQFIQVELKDAVTPREKTKKHQSIKASLSLYQRQDKKWEKVAGPTFAILAVKDLALVQDCWEAVTRA